jgi:RND family efflux transporter MFP subunit
MKIRALLAFTVLLLSLGACSRSPAPGATTTARKPIAVRVAEVAAGPALAPIRAHGLVMVKDSAKLSFKVAGVIADIDVGAGQVVRQGQQLARIEQTEIGSATEQSAQMAQKSKRDLERGEKLYRDQVITLEQVQDLRTQNAVAQAALRGARFNQSYAQITAPFDGVILRKLKQERELAAAGEPVLIVGRASGGYVVQAALSDREVVQTRIGDAVDVQLDAYPGQNFTAQISEVASAADERNGLFVVEAQLNDDAPASLKSGLVARLHWQPGGPDAGTLAYVPMAAIVDGHGRRAVVYAIADGKAQRRDVDVAFIDRERVAISAGVTPGETVVAEGAQFVADGVSVSVRVDDETPSVAARNADAG